MLAIIILFNPDWNRVETVIKELTLSKLDILLVDNSTNETSHALADTETIVYHHMGGNVGIAAAQSLGMQYAIDRGYDFVFHFDQDSSVTHQLLEGLISEWETIQKYDPLVVAIGPSAFNRDSRRYINTENYQETVSLEGFDYYKTDMLMSSGSMVSVEGIKQVGLMRDELFIDNVDYEWSWRAVYKFGRTCYISSKCVLEHQLGEGDKKIMGHNAHITPAFRIYYLFRNYVYLLKFDYVPKRWKIKEFKKLVLKMGYYPIFMAPRWTYFKRMCKGISDGIKMLKTE